MNWEQVSVNWPQVKERARETWMDLSDDDVDEIMGRRELLIGKLQTLYGVSRREAEEEVDDFASRI